MTLGDLLEELRENILNDKTDRTEGTSDYLWTDKTLVRYINEAQRRFAVRALVIRDGSNDEATRIVLRAGQTIYPLHESVLAVISAKIETSNGDLQRSGHSMLAGNRQSQERFWDPSSWDAFGPGPTLAYSTDEATSPDDAESSGVVTLRVYPAPRAEEAGQVVRLRVIRKPIDQFKVTSPEAVPEIPADHHLEMLDWAAYLALRIVDDDAGNPKRAAEFAASFEEHVKAARAEVMRKMFAPTTWGFGRNGFNWTP